MPIIYLKDLKVWDVVKYLENWVEKEGIIEVILKYWEIRFENSSTYYKNIFKIWWIDVQVM